MQAGYDVLLGATNYDPAIMATTVRRMIERKVEGVAVMTSEIEPSLMEQLTGRRIPWCSSTSVRPVSGSATSR